MWSLGNVTIHVDKDSGWQAKPRKGTVELLDTEYSVIHYAGRPSYARSLSFVVFSGYAEEVLPLLTEESVTLVEDSGASTSVTIMDLKGERLYDYKLRDIYRVNVELLQVD